MNAAEDDRQITQGGWAIVALSEIGGMDVDESLLKIQNIPLEEPAAAPVGPLRRSRIWALAVPRQSDSGWSGPDMGRRSTYQSVSFRGRLD